MALIVGHRGAMGHAPENTLLSFQKAIELGCDATEMDVWLSKGKQPIVIHDETVDRTTNAKGKITEMALKEIKKLNCAKGQKIPTLQEVIDFCKGKIGLQIELKGKGTAKAVVELIEKNKILENVVITSFNINFLRETKKFNSEIKTGYLFSLESEKVWDFAREIPLDYVCPKGLIATKQMIERAQALGKSVYCWQVNNKKLGKKLIEWEADAIGTDYPELFKQQ